MAVRVLIVDDAEPYRRAARAVVDGSDGFEAVGEAGSGEDAVHAAGALCPDLVLMDVNLPGIDGLEATRRIRVRSRATVVLLLSTCDADHARWAQQCGAAEYIPKSRFGPDQLTRAWLVAVERATSPTAAGRSRPEGAEPRIGEDCAEGHRVVLPRRDTRPPGQVPAVPRPALPVPLGSIG